MWRDFANGFGAWGLTGQRGGGSRPFAVSDQSLAFGALTLSGAGGIKPAFTGTPAGDFQISGGDSTNYSVDASGYITPASDGSATDGDTFTFGDGTTSATITISAEAGVYSARADNAEIEAAWEDAATDSNATIKVRNGSNAVDAGPVSLAAKAATAEITIQPENYVAATSNVAGTGVPDARLSTRPVTLRGFVAEGVIDYLTIKGLHLIRDRDTEVEANGIIDLYNGSTHITVEDNEICLLTPFSSRDHVANGLTGLMRGIATVNGTGANDSWLVTQNYIHDVSRSMYLLNHTGGEFSKNLVINTYNGPFTVGGASTDGIGILDNLMSDVWASDNDAGSPHAGLGGFDAGPKNVNFVGNLTMVGRARFDHDGLYPGATGVKFNDPTATDSYQNINIGENIILCSANIALELSGVTGANVWNNTIVGTPDSVFNPVQSGTGITIAQDYASSGIKIWNNTVQGFGKGSQYTPDQVSEYGNFVVLYQDLSGSRSHSAIFTGDETKGFVGLAIEEAIAAYVPKTGSYPAMTGIGAQISGYTIGDGGEDTPTFTLPAPTGGTPVDYDLTIWDGANDYAKITSGTLGSVTDAMVFAFEVANVTPSGTHYLMNCTSGIALYQVNTALRVMMKNASGTIVLQTDVQDIFPATASDDRIRIALSFDLSAGRFAAARNGIPITLKLQNTSAFSDDAVNGAGSNFRIGSSTGNASLFEGQFAMAYYDDRFVDLETVSGLNELYASDGSFRAFADTGQAFYYGNAAALAAGNVNHGSGNGFDLVGSVEDVATGATELMPDPGFDDNSKWVASTGFSVTGGKLVLTSPAANASISIQSGSQPSVAPTTGYDFSIDVTSFTAGGRIRIEVGYYDSSNTKISFDRIPSSTVTVSATGTITGSFTTPAATDHLNVAISAIDSGLQMQLDNISVTAA
jgi:hypothetical protein